MEQAILKPFSGSLSTFEFECGALLVFCGSKGYWVLNGLAAAEKQVGSIATGPVTAGY